MSDMNCVVVSGRLTKDMELKYTNTTGTAIGTFSIACNNKRKVNGEWIDEASFFDVIIWGSKAENLQRFLTKGSKIGVTGELKQDRWQDNDGHDRQKIKINGKDICLISCKENRNDNTLQSNQQKKSFKDNFEDDIPF